MSSPYCGAKKTPKGRIPGTFEQCKKSHQIRRYGTFSTGEILIKKDAIKKVNAIFTNSRKDGKSLPLAALSKLVLFLLKRSRGIK